MTLSLRPQRAVWRGAEGEADNLLLRAARALAPGRGAALALEKNLPVASGIGGGSADAAAALARIVQALGRARGGSARPRRWRWGRMCRCACTPPPARMQGIGEVLAPAPRLPEFGMVLVNPGVAVPTPAVFKARTGSFTPAPMLPAMWHSAAAMAAELKPLHQ